MLLFLQCYNFTFVYKKGSLLHLADTVSRAPCQDEAVNPSMSDTFRVFHVHLARLDPPQRPSPIPLASNYAMPHHHALTCTSCSITPSTVREELRIVNDILLKSTRAIVPTSLRPSMLSKNHYYHRGAEYCLSFTYKHVFSLPYLLPVWKASRH